MLKKIFSRILIFSLLYSVLAQGQICSDFLNKSTYKKPLIGDRAFGVEWSRLNSITSLITRVSSSEYKVISNASGEVEWLLVNIGKKNHKIKIKKSKKAKDVFISSDVVLKTGFLYLPLQFIFLLKSINFDVLHKDEMAHVGIFNSRQISLNIQENFGVEILAHELGHVVHSKILGFKRKWKKAIKQDGNTISKYADYSELEDFAETFVAYLEPDFLLQQQYRGLYPHRFELMDKVFMGKGFSWITSQTFFPAARRSGNTVLGCGYALLMGSGALMGHLLGFF